MPGTVTLRAAAFAELDAATLYRLLRLRVDVFVVEQQSTHRELDGRDTEPATRHLWLERAGVPVAYLRVLAEPDGAAHIGRVVVARQTRGSGLASRLMTEALRQIGNRDCVLDAQAHLLDFYKGFGFLPTGPEYLENDIPHVPMRSSATRPPAGR